MERYYASVVKDASAAYTVKRQGEYTVEDYYALPDDQRAELIDGRMYMMAPPSRIRWWEDIFTQGFLNLFPKIKEIAYH